MALETLRGVKKLGEFEVLEERPRDAAGNVDWDLFDALRKANPIFVDHNVNMISFRIQNGPVKEVGVNGCQVDTVIEAAKTILEGLNRKVESKETSIAIGHLGEALFWLEKRRKDRESRGVEGTSQS